MAKEITDIELNQILARWGNYDKPLSSKNKVWKYVEKVNIKIASMIFMLGEFDKDTAFALGEKVGEVVLKPMLLCYYIGYELASEKMAQEDSSLYLATATKSIDSFVLKLLWVLVGKKIVSKEKGREMAIEIACLTGEAANNTCMLGIEDFKKTPAWSK